MLGFQFFIFGVVFRKSRYDQELQYRQIKMSVSLVVEFKSSRLGQGGPKGMGGAARGALANYSFFLFN